MTSPEETVVFGTPKAPEDKTVEEKIVKKEEPKKKIRKKKICGYKETTQGYRWTCQLKPKHEGNHELTPIPRVIPGLERKKKEEARLF